MMAKIKAEIKKAQMEWMGIIKKYQTPNKWKSTWQMASPLGGVEQRTTEERRPFAGRRIRHRFSIRPGIVLD